MNPWAEFRSEAMRLVESLEPTEAKVLACLLNGKSRRDTASCFGMTLDEVEHSFAIMVRKLGAKCTADAVRIGIYAGLGEPK